MKRILSTIASSFMLLFLLGCRQEDKPPLLMCDLADAHESTAVMIHLHGQEDHDSLIVSTDEYGLFSFSPGFTGEFAEIDFMHDGREYGAILQKNKHVKMVIADGKPIFSCDNKECNETCEAIRQIFGKHNFIHTDECPASYDDKRTLLRNSYQKVRQYIANVSDNDMRERLARRAERIHNEYLKTVDILREHEDYDEYNRAIGFISLYDDYICLPSSSVTSLFTSSIN